MWGSLVAHGSAHLSVTRAEVNRGNQARRGEFYSCPGRLVAWDLANDRHLGLLHAVIEAGGFRSIAVSAFETTSAQLFVNEARTVFGAFELVDQMCVDGAPGRMVTPTAGWRSGTVGLARHACAQARVPDAVERWSS